MRFAHRCLPVLVALLVGLGAVPAAPAQSARSRETLDSVAWSVSVLDPEALSTQRARTSDLGDMLAQSVPGLAPGGGSLSNYGQTLRSRSPLVMIDGASQHLEATVNYYSFLQDMKYGRAAGTYGETPTSATSIDEFPGEGHGKSHGTAPLRE